MIDKRFPADTLFLVFEADYRFRNEWHSEPVAGGPLPTLLGAEPSAAPSAAAAPRAAARASKRGEYYVLPTKADASEFQNNVSRDLTNVMKICAQAHRHNVGDIVWMCWQPCGKGKKPARVCSINSGAMFIACSHGGAVHLNGALHSGMLECNHWDVSLKRHLLEHQEDAGASYLVPPMGNYVAHVSGCATGHEADKVRDSCFGEPWLAEGTERAEDAKSRDKWVCHLTTKGQPKWLACVNDVSGLDAVPAWKSYGLPFREWPDWAQDFWAGLPTKRQKRQQRSAFRSLDFRNWVASPGEVSFHCFLF